MNATLLKQRYRILGQAGQGGMGTVYRAFDRQLGDRLVAIKELQSAGQTQREIAEAAAAFKREAIMLAQLGHPSLPSIHDHFYEDGHWYLVMDYISGQTLEDRLHQAGGQGLPLPEVIRMAYQLCDVLEYLHSRHPPIVFRDLKPANIMLTPTGRLYLIDFGIARFFRPDQHGDTQHLGTHGYAAPEQYASAQTQTAARTDLYGLGATLHHTLTGVDPCQHPFLFKPVRLYCPQAPAALESLIARLVERDARLRPASAAAVRLELERITASMRAPMPSAATGRLMPARAGQPVIRGVADPGIPALPAARMASSGSSGMRVAQVSGARPAVVPTVRTTPRPGDLPPPIPGAPKPRPDLTALLVACLLMAGIFGSCVFGAAWLGHGLQTLVAPPVEANLAGHLPGHGAAQVGTTLYTYRGHGNAAVTAVAWSPDGQRIASASQDGTVRVWDALTGAHTVAYQGQGVAVTAVAWSPDGQRIASAGADGVVHVWDAATGRDLLTYARHGAAVTAVAWSPDGHRIASASQDGSVRVWGTDTAQTVVIYRGHGASVNAVAWSPDGQRIVSGSSDRTAQVWDATSAATLAIYRGHTAGVTAVVWSPDGGFVASGSQDGTMQFWSPDTALAVANEHSRSGAVNALTWSPDGRHIAAAVGDARQVLVWNVDPVGLAYSYLDRGSPVLAVAWSPDGTVIASAYADGKVRVWRAG